MKKKLKIGIFLNDKINLKDGQIKILSDLINSDYLDLKILISNKNKKHQKKNILYKLITFFEKKYLNIYRKKELKNIEKKISKIKKYNLKNENIDEFLKKPLNSNNLKKIDLLFFLEKNNLIKTKLVNFPKYGSWILDFGVYDHIYAGFWDCYLNKDVTKVEIQKVIFKNFENKFLIVDKGFYSTKINAWFLNRDFILEKSAILVKKNLRLLSLRKNGNNFKRSTNILRKNPNFISMIFYMLEKYPRALIRKFFSKIFYFNKKRNLNEPNHNPWNLHIGSKKKIKEIDLSKSIRIKPDKGEAWADPFLISFKNSDFIFFENFEFKNQKGKISCIELRANKVLEKFDILNKSYHLSYPFIWREKKSFFMIPETSNNKCIQIWRSKNFPKNWSLYKKIFIGESCVDTTILNIKKDERWIFTNKTDDKYMDHNSELYLFKTNAMFTKIIPHELNPVITDSRFARNAGNIFREKKNKLIRPSQINIFDFYGRGLNLKLIKKLNLKKYNETQFRTFLPNFKININAIHHMSQDNEKYTIDIRYKKFLSFILP